MLAFSFPVITVIRSHQTSLCLTLRSENILLEFFRDVVYCLIIKVLCCLSCDSFDILPYLSSLVNNFFKLFFAVFFKIICRPTAHLDYHICHFLSIHIFYFFKIFLSVISSIITNSALTGYSKWHFSHKSCLNLFQTALRLTEKEGFEPSRRY